MGFDRGRQFARLQTPPHPVLVGRTNGDTGVDGIVMYSLFIFLLRLVSGTVIFLTCWFVLDMIHDRNTEIIVSVVGLMYCFVFFISRRLDHFGLSIFSIFGRTVSYVNKTPYDRLIREEVGLISSGGHLYLNYIFVVLIEILCVFRLFTSLLGRGWDALFDPVNTLIGHVF